MACAEASLEGNFSRVLELSQSSMQLQAFAKDTSSLMERWQVGVTHKTELPKKQLTHSKHRDHVSARKKLRVTLAGKVFQESKATDTFVSVLECIGFERVAKLNKRLSGIPLVSKTAKTDYQSQKKVGMWYVTRHSSVDNMKKLLDEVGKELNLLMSVSVLEPSVK
ncbi:hypothetical protein [Thiothrix winogradskyi]|uniref:Uncharacterized protein n=1 Tax=Thiothrix winogradskyi TaxID=96472 RepID=A0ABY3T274_9GAMM|nr:hypothetical protein [Thiothrix winogradskyi]UJS24879.1 hypothetical protein L2Y54_02255 [Thiothrix winogradskyi]